MHIGIAFDLKPDAPLPDGVPDDLHEEFDSPQTVDSIIAALESAGHTTQKLGNGTAFLKAILQQPPDLVFNLAEGVGVSRNRESRIPAVCEMLGIPYTGSDPLTLGLTLDKDLCRRIVAEAGILIPNGLVLKPPRVEDWQSDYAEFAAMLAEVGLVFPVILKPICEGSSKGIRNRCVVDDITAFGQRLQELWQGYQQPVLVEEFIAGEEVTIALFGSETPEVFGAMRISPKKTDPRFIYSIEVKRNYETLVDYETPAQLPYSEWRALEQAALAAYSVLGCRDVARLDFRIRQGQPYFLEANPLPGLSPITSDLLLIAQGQHLTHTELVLKILSEACQRYDLSYEAAKPEGSVHG